MANLQELNKNELQVEATMRGVQVQPSWTAAQILLALKEVSTQKEYKLYCPQVTNFELELKNFQVAREVLLEYFETCMEQPTPHRKLRLIARLKHWLYRVKEFSKLVSDSEKEFVAEIEKEFNGYLNWQSQETESNENQNTQLGDTTNAEEGASVHTYSCDFSGPQQTNALVPDRTMTVDNPNMHGQSNVATVVNPPVPYEVLKLDNPLSSILKQVRELSVANRDSILHFLNIFVRVCRQATFLKIDDVIILKMLYPYCRGMLAEFIVQAIELGYTLDRFHNEFLAAYLPLTVISRFIAEFVLRPQRINESLAEYIQLVKLHSEMFKTTYTEAQLVEIIIMNSIRPEIRSLYLGSAAPKTFIELSTIVMKLNQCDTGDNLRSQPSSLQFKSQQQQLSLPSKPYIPAVSRPRIVCFFCGKPGHMRRDCKARKRLQSTPQDKCQRGYYQKPGMHKRRIKKDKKPFVINKIQAITKSFVPYIKIGLQDLEHRALLDSGSVSSIINFRTFKNLNLALSPSKIKCYSATAQPVNIIGAVDCKVRIDRYTWRHTFLVSDNITSDVVLGADFITHSRLLIDLSARMIFFGFDPSNKVEVFNSPCLMARHDVRSCEETSVSNSGGHLNLDHLTSKQKQEILSVVKRFPTVFTSKMGLTNELEYDIVLEDHKPVRLPPYRLSPPRLKVMKQHIDKMLEDGVIRPSTSNYSSPIFLVPKGEKEFRPVVDYRVLNSKILVDSTPLPDIHTCFHWFKKAQFFTSLDLNSAYHQIPLSESCRKYTAFATDWNLYEFCRVPFGIAVGAQVLTRLLDKIFSDIKFKFIYNYLDDLVIYSETFEEHLEHIREVLARLKRANLTVKLAKVKFAARELSFLGHKISPGGISIDQERTRAIRNFPPQRTPRAFHGLWEW